MLSTIVAFGHTAVVDHATGTGLAVLPHDRLNIELDAGSPTLHHEERAAFLAELRRTLHYVPVPAEDDHPDLMLVEGLTRDGRVAVSIYAQELPEDEPTPADEARAHAELCDSLGGLMPADGGHFHHLLNRVVA